MADGLVDLAHDLRAPLQQGRARSGEHHLARRALAQAHAKRRFSRVDYRDVAEAAAVALTEDRLLYGTFELCAEGWLDRKDVAAIVAEVLGRPVRAERIDPKTAAAGAGPGAPALERMFDWYDRRAPVSAGPLGPEGAGTPGLRRRRRRRPPAAPGRSCSRRA